MKRLLHHRFSAVLGCLVFLSMTFSAVALPPAVAFADCPAGEVPATSADGHQGCCPTAFSGLQNDGHTCCPSGTQGSTTKCLFAKYINPAVQTLSALVAVVVVVGIVYGGIEYSSSGGDPQRAAAGKKHITEALIGLLAYLLLYAFLQFIIPGGVLNNGG